MEEKRLKHLLSYFPTPGSKLQTRCCLVLSLEGMAEPERDAPTTNKKSSLPIDEDFGKDFLNSWKSSKAGNSVDFDVETVPKNGKSSFSFDKLDDFDLGGEFKKLSSFQMDISDLDFSVPPKKTAKANAKESLGKQELKNDKFSFAFDFNELDKFDFDTKMTETEIPSSKCTKYNGPPCTDEVLKQEKCLELKNDLVLDGCHSERHEDEGLPNTNSLSSSSCAPTLEPDGQSHNTATIHEFAKERLTQIPNKFALDFVNCNASKDKDIVARSFNGSPSGYSSPVKSSNSRSCPLKSRTGSEACAMAPQNDEVDQHEVSGGNKYSNVSAQVRNEVVGSSAKVVMQKYVDTPRVSSNDNTGSPLLVQDISQKDDKGHSAKLMTLSAMKTAGAFERNLAPKLIVSSITTTLPSKRKTFEEPFTDPKVLDTSKHINFSPNIRVNSSSPAKSIAHDLLSAPPMSGQKNSPIEAQDILQKDGSKSSPNLMTLRMIKGNSTISNSSMSKEVNLVERIKGNLASKSTVSFTTEKHVLPSSPLKMKIMKDTFINLKAFNPFKRVNFSPERESMLISPGNGADVAQRAENPEGSKDVCLEKSNSATEIESMEIEMPVLTENNGNAEKADSYSKELEDLCIMLKKKHEEAKELLVRAVVNNNKLLMLNHPMIEEKIRVLQRFASSLQSKDWEL